MTEPYSTDPGLNYKNDPTKPPHMTVTSDDDPAYRLLLDDRTSTPTPGVYRSNCYICRDPEFSQMGLPLCQGCPKCTKRWRELNPKDAEENPNREAGHVPADDSVCDDCGYDLMEEYYAEQEAERNGLSYKDPEGGSGEGPAPV